MISFYEELKNRNLESLLEPVEYKYEGFYNDRLLFDALDDIKEHNKKVLIYGDPDVDGLSSLLIVREALERIGHKNFEVYDYDTREHSVNINAVTKAIYEKFDYMIIVDSSSNDVKNISMLIEFGVTPIIIDHHVTHYDDYKYYPSGCVIISSDIENRLRHERFYKVSAGAMCFSLFGKYLEDRKYPWKDLSAYGLISLYSDCIEMSPKFNRGIYYLATSLKTHELPRFITDFFFKTSVFSRRFIEFTLAPKINALFRSENFNILNAYFLRDLSYVERQKLLLVIDEVHSEARTLVSRVSDTIEKKNLNNIVIGNLSTSQFAINENKLYNYTGLVANNLSSEYGKPSVVLCETGTYIKGSFRDLFSRNYLPKFKQFCYAEGHGAAFGIKLQYNEVDNFLYCLEELVDKKFFILGVQEPIEVQCDTSYPDDKLLGDMALYNEFSGTEIPIALLTKKNDLISKTSYSKSSRYTYEWGSYRIDSSYVIPPGSMIKIKPTLTSSIKLITYTKNIML